MSPLLFVNSLDGHVMPRLTDYFSDQRLERLNSAHNRYVDLIRTMNNLPILFGEQLQQRQGKWRNFFATQMPNPPQGLVVEIGRHRGPTLVNLAQNHPHLAFLGLDITFKRVVLTAQRSLQHNLTNVCCLLLDARVLDQVCAPDELNAVICFFPDPWLRIRQRKHRLFNSSFSQQLATLIKANGFLWLKSDNKQYLDHCDNLMTFHGFRRYSQQLLIPPPATIFERRFTERAISIYESQWQKVS